MAIDLPDPIARYFAADGEQDGDAIARCFTQDAVVHDEGRSHAGHDAIRRWKAESSARYSYTATPVALAADGARTMVTAHLVGDFPGSPVDLRYSFLLAAGGIAALEIRP